MTPGVKFPVIICAIEMFIRCQSQTRITLFLFQALLKNLRIYLQDDEEKYFFSSNSTEFQN